MPTAPPYQPVIILGAARSGTNMLRDALCTLPGVASWPCDEINPIWRHGNLDVPHDEFAPELARPAVVDFLRRAFDRQARRSGCRFLVEKTCANSLRVGFVHRAFPDARYLYIHRDGADAVPSAMKRWTAPFDLGYTLSKVRFVPPGDLPHYLLRFVANRLHRLRDRERRLGTWGPRFRGIQELAAQAPLFEVCVEQWARCVAATEAQIDAIPAAQLRVVRYEDFVADPLAAMAGIATWLGGGWRDEALRAAVAGVRAESVGRGAAGLDDAQLARIEQAAAGLRRQDAGTRC